MSSASSAPAIQLRGVRQNNLKNFDLDLPIGKLIVVTGLSGSGKSSLAFDTLYAEGQRRYIETFSPYARQFFDRMDKPQVDAIHGIPPAIAIEQRNSVKSTRSTVGTMTEVCDSMKVLWPHVAKLHCRQCGRRVTKDSPQEVWGRLMALAREGAGAEAADFLVVFDLPLSEKISVEDTFALIAKQGYQRLLLGAPPSAAALPAAENYRVARLEEALPELAKAPPATLSVVQDRLKVSADNRKRFIEASEQAYHFGKGRLRLVFPGRGEIMRFSNRLHCAECDIEYKEPSTALFSFNNPVGACPTCKGFGRTIAIDYHLALPDRSLTLAGGVVKPWQGGQSAECQDDLMKACKKHKVPVNVPFRELSREHQDWVINGETDYGIDEDHKWPRLWYGVKGYFRSMEGYAYKMHVRVLLSRYRSYHTCPVCQGRRFQPESLCYKATLPDGKLLTLSEFYQLHVEDALGCLRQLVPDGAKRKGSDPLGLIFGEVSSRLDYLNSVGLGYLTLDRPTRSLSGGETERVSLTTCLGSRLVNTLFILDEPSVGLHPHDVGRLIQILRRLQQAGNTVVVVEHEASVMKAADQVVDLGPGHGAAGGSVVFQGSYPELIRSTVSLTGKYLSGREKFEKPPRRAVNKATPRLVLTNATRHNLKELRVEIPLGRFVCVTGVSGSGKTTLVREVLLPALESRLGAAEEAARTAEGETGTEEDQDGLGEALGDLPQLSGVENIGRVILVDQSSIGRTPRSNPAVYLGAFEHIREVFADSEAALQRGLSASAFSFNSQQGQCETCRGAGFEKIEMQFLSDIYIRCSDCDGRRYRPFLLEVRISPDAPAVAAKGGKNPRALNIAEVLDATVDEAVEFLAAFAGSKHAARAVESLKLLQEVGLGYLRLGQPINTLSGGESQRLKLAGHLTEFVRDRFQGGKPALFLFDEPTTGLHFDDVRVLLRAFQRLVEAGHSLVVIEHNLDVIRAADWLLDIGPGAGHRGGRLVAQGAPEQVAASKESLTGLALREG